MAATITNNLNFACNWRYGFNLDPGAHATVGYVLFWSGIGGLNLPKDIEVWNPFDSPGQKIVKGEKVQCIGIIDTFRFAGGGSDPIRISAYVSKDTAANVLAKLARPLPSMKLKLSWYIIAYDADKKAWYEAAFARNNAKVDANVDAADGRVQLFIDNVPTPISESLDVRVYKLEFQVVPAKGKSATLEFATGPDQRLVKEWGQADDGDGNE